MLDCQYLESVQITDSIKERGGSSKEKTGFPSAGSIQPECIAEGRTGLSAGSG